MPPLSPPFILFTLLVATTPSSSAPAPCTPSPSDTGVLCPPFPNSTSISYPFSSTPGCGHPAFQIRCATPHSLLSINGVSFSLLDFLPNSSSLRLSPHLATTNDPVCPAASQFPFLPPHPINLSDSPFSVPRGTCSRLNLLRPCLSLPLNPCHWHHSLLSNPSSLFYDCASPPHPTSSASQIPCQLDVLGYLNMFLAHGFIVERAAGEDDDIRDSYFADCDRCRSSKDGTVCGYNAYDPKKPFRCFGSETTSSTRRRIHRVIASCFFLLFCLISSSATAVLLLRSRRVPSFTDAAALFLRRTRSAALLPPAFTYEELERATNRFDPCLKIGDGGFGSVYQGKLQDGRSVAVKRLRQVADRGAFSAKSFCNEILILILSSIDHPNLVKLHGYCSDQRGLLLVYGYVPNGTLADHLHGPRRRNAPSSSSSLSWRVRVEMALQVAAAMEYLHFSVHPPIVHRDITTANVFVEEDMRVRLGDFGMSRLMTGSSSSESCVWTGPQGTPGYLDPDYYRSFRLTEKSDVYSFGVVLLELITGKKAVERGRELLVETVVGRIQTGQLREVVDPGVRWEDRVAAVAELAFRCVAWEKDDRPDAREVVAELRRNLGGDPRGS